MVSLLICDQKVMSLNFINQTFYYLYFYFLLILSRSLGLFCTPIKQMEDETLEVG